jgi:iron complex transport system substrate-binding protein
MFRGLTPVLIFLAFVSCKQEKREHAATSDSTWVKYASGFRVEQGKGAVTHVYVTNPYQNSTSGIHYVLVNGEIDSHDAWPDAQVIRVPIDKIVCTATTHIPHLDYLGVTDKLVGFPTTDYISSEKMRKRVDAGEVTELGIDKGMDLERLFSLHPSMVMGYTMSADLGQLKKIQELGIPVVINAEYLEGDPLGRAEWIKFTSLFFGKEREADSVFALIEQEYKRVKELASSVETRPTVMSGIVYGDTWFMPGGQNYAATLLQDAGCNYLWRDTKSTGYLELSFESVFQKAKDADLWIGVGSFNSLNELEAAEGRYALFRPFTSSQVYNFNARMGARGGNDFLESGYLRPDLIISDVVKIAHPELLPQYELYFHKKLTVDNGN